MQQTSLAPASSNSIKLAKFFDKVWFLSFENLTELNSNVRLLSRWLNTKYFKWIKRCSTRNRIITQFRQKELDTIQKTITKLATFFNQNWNNKNQFLNFSLIFLNFSAFFKLSFGVSFSRCTGVIIWVVELNPQRGC